MALPARPWGSHAAPIPTDDDAAAGWSASPASRCWRLSDRPRRGGPQPARTSGTNSRQPIFKLEALAAFDSESYFREGFWVFPAVMTDAARESWLAARRRATK